ncbi:hypothetical protein CMI39_03575 [Candidatus Pacearchaeota archaeon]|jgi:hypothetical protein|nr:hypothetical protein [Candidatus Pacearchaeota archaeon]|tara:strand:+ start:3796 stop:4356 length:561 start_codon:yes stop_codon:yes gene_type:complete
METLQIKTKRIGYVTRPKAIIKDGQVILESNKPYVMKNVNLLLRTEEDMNNELKAILFENQEELFKNLTPIEMAQFDAGRPLNGVGLNKSEIFYLTTYIDSNNKKGSITQHFRDDGVYESITNFREIHHYLGKWVDIDEGMRTMIKDFREVKSLGDLPVHKKYIHMLNGVDYYMLSSLKIIIPGAT